MNKFMTCERMTDHPIVKTARARIKSPTFLQALSRKKASYLFNILFTSEMTPQLNGAINTPFEKRIC